MQIVEIVNVFREKLPEIANQIGKLSDNEDFKDNMSKSGSIGGLINIGFYIFNEIRNKVKTKDEILFSTLITVMFDSAKESIPKSIANLSIHNIKNELDLKEIFNLFKDDYAQNYYHLPDHPAVNKFREKMKAILKENHESKEVQKFIVSFNSKIILKTTQLSKTNELLKDWEFIKSNNILIEYLEYLKNLLEDVNPVDDRPISDYYIENDAVIIEKRSWEKKASQLTEYSTIQWNIEDFFKSNKKREFIAAEFGTGKTNYVKKIASDFASKYLNGETTYVPVYVPLRRNLNNIFQDYRLEDIIKLLEGERILLICDGLDEYKGDINNLIYQKLPSLVPNECKTIFTTRLEPDFQNKIDISSNYYIRLLPFKIDQIDEFFSRSKYNLKGVTYQSIIEFGLVHDEISKPLFCWMFAVMYTSPDSNLEIKNIEDLNTKRALFFQEVIHSIIVGKHKKSENGENKLSQYTKEKQILREIAHLYFLYNDNLTTKIIAEELNISEDEILRHPVITTYFNLLTTWDVPKKVEFFHKSFFEYLLAESFIENFITEKIERINIDIPTHETILILEGLLEVVNNDDNNSIYQLKLKDSLPMITESSSHYKELILQNAKKYFNEDKIKFSSYKKFFELKFVNMNLHRWISIFVINKLEPTYGIDKRKLFDLIRITSNFTPEYLQRIENFDLTHSEISSDIIGPSPNLSKANISYSNFSGTFYNAKFIGTNLSNSKFKPFVKLIDVNFQGADCSGLIIQDKEEHLMDSDYLVSFIKCYFNTTKFIKADLSHMNFSLSKFINTDISGANLEKSNISLVQANFIMTNNETKTVGIELFAKDYGLWSSKVEWIKNHINFLIEDIDINTRKIIARDNPSYF